MLLKISNFFLTHKIVVIILLGVLGGLGFLGVRSFVGSKPVDEGPLEEIELLFDPEGLYALLYPRRDGNALNLNFKRAASYDAFSYVIAYTDDEGIPRGAGDENTWINLEKGKSEYEQEILFGTCSRNVCKYDTGVENGTLTLRLKKGNKVFKTSTQWRVQKAELTAGLLSSGDEHFKYKLGASAGDLSLIGNTVINDLSGAPKLPRGKVVSGKVYSLNSTIAKDVPAGDVSIELAETPASESKIVRYSENENKWIELETKIDGNKLEASSTAGGIFAVLVPSK